MTEGWKTKKLGDVCDLLNRGISPKYLEEGGVCVLNQKCIRNHQINYEPSRRHDLSEKKVSEGRFIQLGDVLVNSTGTGTLGRVAQVREEPVEPTTVDSHITVVRPKKSMFYLDFFGYMLVVIEDAIKDAGEGCGGQTELARSVLAEKFFVSFPESFSEQQQIVKILDESFEGIAIVKANTEKKLKNAKEIFESYLNDIFTTRGNGWVITTLDKISTNLDSKRIPITKDVRKSGVYPYYGASGIVDYVDDYIFEDDTLLVSEDGANLLARSTPIAFSATGKYWVNNHAHILKFENMATQKIVEFYLGSIKLDKYITGAAQPKLNQSSLNLIPIPIPKAIDVQVNIVENIESFSAKIHRLESIYQSKLIALDELKKSLLEQAFSGNLKGSP